MPLLNKLRKGVASMPIVIIASCLTGLISYSVFKGVLSFGNAAIKIDEMRVAQQIAANEIDRIRAVNYDSIVAVEKTKSDDAEGYYKEIILSKEYREDLGNTTMKHKPIVVNIYKDDSFLPLVTLRGDKVSRWYHSGSFDDSDNGIYDETDTTHEGSIHKTGPGTGYVFLKKGSSIDGEVEIYDETNGDIYIYNSLGTASSKTVIKHIGPSTSSGYIRLAETCTVSGTVTFENSSNGGIIAEGNLNNVNIIKRGNGLGYLLLGKNSKINGTVQVYNESDGAIVVNGTIADGAALTRTGSSESLLIINGNITGNVTINMDNSGKVTITGPCKDNLKVNYSSSTNKPLLLSAYKVSGNVNFVNSSKGAIEFSGTMTNGCSLNVSGKGDGTLYILKNAVIKKRASIVNDTSGYISLDMDIKDNAVIRKLGSNIGSMSISSSVIFEGSFTLYSDGSGYYSSFGNFDVSVNDWRMPIFADGAYIYVKGSQYGIVRFVDSIKVLGRVNVDVSKNPYKSLYVSTYGNGNLNYNVIPDGYTYTL